MGQRRCAARGCSARRSSSPPPRSPTAPRISTSATPCRELFARGAVPIVNENDATATDEIAFGDNDALAAIVAVLTGASLLVLLTEVDGVYTRRPGTRGRRADRRRLRRSARRRSVRARSSGRGGMRSKILAAELAASAAIPTVIAAGRGGRRARPDRRRGAARHALRAERRRAVGVQALAEARASVSRDACTWTRALAQAVAARRPEPARRGRRALRGPVRRGRRRRARRARTAASFAKGVASAGRGRDRHAARAASRRSTATASSCSNSSNEGGRSRCFTDTRDHRGRAPCRWHGWSAKVVPFCLGIVGVVLLATGSQLALGASGRPRAASATACRSCRTPPRRSPPQPKPPSTEDRQRAVHRGSVVQTDQMWVCRGPVEPRLGDDHDDDQRDRRAEGRGRGAPDSRAAPGGSARSRSSSGPATGSRSPRASTT